MRNAEDERRLAKKFGSFSDATANLRPISAFHSSMERSDDDQDPAFVRLLTEYQAVIRAFVISLLPGAPGLDDLIQDINEILWRKRGDFEPGTNFKAWALTIARFQVMGYCRVLRRQHWVTIDDDVAELVADDLEERLEARREERRIRALEACMAKLREVDRELLLERYWRKTRLQDFAVISGRSLGGLKVQLFRLRAALKRCVEARLAEEGRTA